MEPSDALADNRPATVRGECPRHGDFEGLELVYRLPGAGVRRLPPACPRCEGERTEARVRADAATEEQKRERRLARSGIPPRFRGASFETYRASGREQELALRTVKKYAQVFAERRKAGAGMILIGQPGTGKTHLLCALAAELSAYWRPRYADCWSVLSEIKATFRRDARETESGVIDSYVAPDLLILDEVGVQYGSDAERALLHRVIDLRYQRVAPTIVAGNVDLEGVKTYLGERAVSRLMENNGVVLPFNWGDHRMTVKPKE